LVDNEIGVSRCLRELQSLCQEYCKWTNGLLDRIA
jgi:hypothetical protein